MAWMDCKQGAGSRECRARKAESRKLRVESECAGEMQRCRGAKERGKVGSYVGKHDAMRGARSEERETRRTRVGSGDGSDKEMEDRRPRAEGCRLQERAGGWTGGCINGTAHDPSNP